MGRKMSGKLKYGVGYNPGGKYKTRVDGSDTRTYKLWSRMIERAYSTEYHKKQPTYKDVTVDERWHNYQVFAEDIEQVFGYNMIDGNGKVYQLDKDILVKDNKVYSKETVCFIPSALNKFTINKRETKDGLPTGISIVNNTSKYTVQIAINGKQKNLGLFTNVSLARAVYVDARNQYARELAERYEGKVDPRVIDILNNWNEEEHSE